MEASSPADRVVWRTAGGDNARRGRFTGATALRRRPRRTLQAQGAIQAEVVFDALGGAFIADMAGGVQAYSKAGDLRWRVRVEGGISATPVLGPADAVLFVGTHSGQLVALDAATGATRWGRPIPSARDPRILSDLLHLAGTRLVVLSSWSGRFHAVDADTGETRFDWDAGISPRSPASADQTGTVFTLRAMAGRGVEFVRVGALGREEVLHREPEDSRGAARALVAAAPVLDEGRDLAYVVWNHERGGRLVAWSLRKGTVAWTRELTAAVQATPAVLPGGAVVVGDLAGNVQGFDPDGGPRYQTALHCDFLLAGGVSAGGGGFLIGDPQGALHEVDERGGRRLLFEAPRSLQARPSYDPFGTLHVPCTNGLVYCLEPAARAA